MRRTALTVAFMVFLSAFVVIITVLPEARATTLYVGGGGPGNHTTIQEAIDNANPGDTVYVYNGTYVENVVVDRTISLIGENRSTTTIDGNGTGDVVHVTTDWVNITGITVTNSGSIPEEERAGIKLSHAEDCFIGHNNVSHNRDGIHLFSSAKNTIANNTVFLNTRHGIYVYNNADGNIISTNSVFSNSGSGIYPSYSRDNIVINNNASNNRIGIHLFSAGNNTIANNTVLLSSEHGMLVVLSDLNIIVDNMASLNADFGIALRGSHNNTILNNTVSSNQYTGIGASGSNDNTIVGNVVSSNGWSVAIALGSSKRNNLINNEMIRNGIFLGGDLLEHWNTHTIETSNTVNGKPVQYWKNATGGTIPSGAGQVILANSTSVLVDGQNVSNGAVGVEVGFSSGISISNITASGNRYGMFLWNSSDSAVASNIISRNEWGMYLFYSRGNTFANNTVSSNEWEGVYFFSCGYNMIVNNSILNNTIEGIIFARSHNNTVARNYFSTNGKALQLSDCHNNTVHNNTVMTNSYGFYLHSSNSDNRIYHNRFVDNLVQAYDNTDTNLWDNDYPSGGNHWSDYSGVDHFRGPRQDIPGSDGIGDTPYVIDSDSRDRYPLVSPGTVYPRPPENVTAVLSGRTFENVTIMWEPSPDESIGLVERYNILRGESFNASGNLYSDIGSVPNGTHQFVDVSAGEGNPNTYFYAMCAINMTNDSTCADSQAGKFTRPLAAGPNLVSIPLIQSDESIETVLQTVQYDKAWYYDSSSQEWKWYMKSKTYRRELWSVNHTMGIWVNVTEDCNLTVAGIVPAQTTIHLYAGWNLVSFPSVNTSFTVGDLKASLPVERVEGFDPDPPYFLRVLSDSDVLLAGQAYWVKVQGDVLWNVSFE